VTTTLHLTNAYHATSGGIRTFYTALLEAGNREGRRVVLVVPDARDASEPVGAFGHIYRVRTPRAPAFDRRYRLMLPHRYAPLAGTRIASILAREAPAVVEICDKYTLPYLAAMLRKGWYRGQRRPALVGLSCERFDDNMAAFVSRGSLARRFTRWYLRHVYGPPFDLHIAVSGYTAEELRDALWDRPGDFIRVSPMGVDAERFGPGHRDPDLRRRLLTLAGGHEGSTLLVYAGRLSPEKNIPLLLDMMRVLGAETSRDYRLVLIGDGPLRGSIERHIAAGALAGRVAVCGALTRDRIPAACASGDVFVHPNPREPFGIGPLEAMASGVPVVLPGAGGVLEYASESTAWVVPADPQAFARAVRAAAAGDQQRLVAARCAAQRFRWHHVTRQFFALYDEAAARFGGLDEANDLLPGDTRLSVG
jgi:alpha-1,6-mannosyltransferase